MKVEMKLIGADKVALALRKVPAKAADEIRDEMRGMNGLGVEWKKAIARTFVGRRQGQKWLYSEKNDKKYNAIGHEIQPRSHATLDNLSLRIWASDRAAIHELGGTVTPKDGDFLWVPIGRLRNYKDLRERLRPSHLLRSALELIKVGGRLFIVERRATEKQAERGDSTTKFLFALKEQIRHPGGKLKFRATTAQMRPRAIRRFERALGRAIKAFNEAA